jgi:hypothetical protein
MPREWRFLSVLAWRWERLGAEAGVTTRDGTEDTITSTLTITTTSSTIPTDKIISATAIVLLNSPVAVGAVTGSTIRSTAAELPTEIETRQIDSAAQPAGLPSLTVEPMRASNRVSRAVGPEPAQWIAAPPAEVDNRAVLATVVAEATG